MHRFKIREMESKEGLEALFSYATEGILITDARGTIVRINPSAEKLFGYEHGELNGQRIEVLVPEKLRNRHEHHRDHYAQNPHARAMGAGMDLYGVKKDGTEFPVEISLSPYNSDNGRFVIAFIIDITIRKQAEEKLRDYSVDLEKQVRNRTLILEEAVEELEKTKKNLHDALAKERELNELKSRFVSMASHEFRTPLTTMMSSLSLIKRYGEQNEPEKQEKHIGRVKSSINNLTEILEDFLSLSKLEEGHVRFHPEEVNLRECLEDVAGEMRNMAREGQHLELHYSGSETVIVDCKILRNVLFNLISNAIKFSPSGGTVTIDASAGPDLLHLSVKDEGVGISPEDRKHLFERFFRGSNATHIQGTGLGLSIVARYAELMNARLSVESEPEKGSTFHIYIPHTQTDE